jgi:hypothetical protein
MEGFTGMNSGQLLVFASQDQEADRKMKRKVDLFAEPLLESQTGLSELIKTDAEAIPKDYENSPQNPPVLRRN